MSLSLKEIKKYRDLAKEADLEGKEVLWLFHNSRLQSICNGIGPDAFPEWLRDAISALHPTLAPVAAIHDVQWYLSDGSVANFIASNRGFRRNGFRMAKLKYGWYNPLRYVVMRQADRFARLCNLFGWRFWKSAAESNNTKERNK